MSDKGESFEEWLSDQKLPSHNDYYLHPDDLEFIWNHQQNKYEPQIKSLEAENEELKEERMMLRRIAYAYRGLDCLSSTEAIEVITKEGWQKQLDYEKWCEANSKDVGFLDWKELEGEKGEE